MTDPLIARLLERADEVVENANSPGWMLIRDLAAALRSSVERGEPCGAAPPVQAPPVCNCPKGAVRYGCPVHGHYPEAISTDAPPASRAGAPPTHDSERFTARFTGAGAPPTDKTLAVGVEQSQSGTAGARSVWQPIESAPRDGRTILGWPIYGYDGPREIYWSQRGAEMCWRVTNGSRSPQENEALVYAQKYGDMLGVADHSRSVEGREETSRAATPADSLAERAGSDNLRRVVEAHCLDLERCLPALDEYREMADTAREFRAAISELRAALSSPAAPETGREKGG